MDGTVDAYLARADLRWPLGRVRRVAPVVAVAPAVLAVALGVSPLMMVVCLIAPGAGMALWITRRVAGRPDRVVAQLPDALRAVAAGVASGLSLRRSLVRVAPGTPEPAGAELRRLSDDLESGARTDEALEAFAQRVPHQDVAVLMCVMGVALRSGGDLGELLRELADGMESRRAAAAEAAALSSQARTTAWMVVALPVAGAALVELAAPGVLTRTADSALGRAALMAGVSMLAVAIALVRRLSRPDD